MKDFQNVMVAILKFWQEICLCMFTPEEHIRSSCVLLPSLLSPLQIQSMTFLILKNRLFINIYHHTGITSTI